MPKDQPVDRWFLELVEKVDSSIDEAAEEWAEEGAETVDDLIASRGTGRTWKRVRYKRGIARSGSKNGRDWTGDMRGDAGDNESFRKGSDVAVGRFGWYKNYKDYYGEQEGGFEHPQTGWVEGMNAMGDAADYMGKRAGEILSEKMRKNGL